MYELKRCPFCGGTARAEVMASGISAIYCTYCGVSTQAYSGSYEAIKAWNKRIAESRREENGQVDE